VPLAGTIASGGSAASWACQAALWAALAAAAGSAIRRGRTAIRPAMSVVGLLGHV